MGVLSAYSTRLTFAQRTLYDRLRSQGIQDDIARQLAVAIEKSTATSISKKTARKPMGAAFAHARATGDDQSHEARKKRANRYLRSKGHKAIGKSDSYSVPAGVRSACKRGLDLAPEHGGQGLTEGAKARARAMASGSPVSSSQLARMRSFFARHGSYEKSSSPPSPGYVSWLLWGGDAGRSWANSHDSEDIKKGGSGSGRYAAGSKLGDTAAIASNRAHEQSAKAEQAGTSVAHSVAQVAHHYAAMQNQADGLNATAKAHDDKAAYHREQAAGHATAVNKASKDVVALSKFGPLPSTYSAPMFLENDAAAPSAPKKRKKKRDGDREKFKFSSRIIKSISKPWQNLVYSVVYAPDQVDLHGDVMDAQTIETAAHEAMRKGLYVNHEHGPDRLKAHVVESYVAPCDMQFHSTPGETTIQKGTWVVGMKINDNATWQRVLDGTYQGFSLEGSGVPYTVAA